jgi:hypothetical protein
VFSVSLQLNVHNTLDHGFKRKGQLDVGGGSACVISVYINEFLFFNSLLPILNVSYMLLLVFDLVTVHEIRVLAIVSGR